MQKVMLKSYLTDLRLKGYLLVTRMKKKKKQEERERNDALDNTVEYAFCYR